VVITAHHLRSYLHGMETSRTDRGQPPRAAPYEIRLQGHLAARWAAWFDEMVLTREEDGTTLLAGPVADQAALHGLLHKVRDTGLPLVSVTCVARDHQTTTPPPRRPT